MPKVHEGQLVARGRKFGIAVSRFNDLVTTRLLDGALDCIQRHGGDSIAHCRQEASWHGAL